ncbi:MAG: tetratricopeptide repeat protein [Candidatus Poribacteria bacterium]|nr:tetratricopeptide repeat protein [Candidatus Poribacteria bacterium]
MITVPNPQDHVFYNNRGIDYGEKGEYDLAIEDFTKAIELKPDYAIAYNNRGAVYRSKGEYDKTIDDCNKAIQLKSNYAEPYSNRGAAYRNKGDYERAIEDYNKAIQLKPNFVQAYYNRGLAYHEKSELDIAIKDYSKAIELNPKLFHAYNNRGNAYRQKDDFDSAIGDYSKAIELNPELGLAHYNRSEAWLHLKEWDKAKADLTTAKKLGMDIIAAFHNAYKNVETFEKRKGFKVRDDVALMLTQRRRNRYPKTLKILDADGKPLESPNVVNLREQLRNIGKPLGKYLNAKPAFGINTAPTEAFVVDKATRSNLIAAHPSSADILKPFLHGHDLRRWHAEPQGKWLIFAHRGIAINEYPAILKYLEKHKDSLSKRAGKQAWYELQASYSDPDRFAQSKLVCPNLYEHQTFAVDTAGFYCGNTAYLIPTEETWLCGLLNSRVVEWFYSQVSNQLTIDYLRARSGYMQQIPVPDITSTQKALIDQFVAYLIYLQQQPTTNSNDLAHARDAIMLRYFERIIDGMIYESYLPDELHKGRKHFFQPLLDEQLPQFEEIQGDKMSVFRDIFEHLYERKHPVAVNLFFLDSVKPVRIIQGKL